MNDAVSRENNEKSFSRSIEMKLSWPPRLKDQKLLQPNLTPAWTPCVSSIWFDSSRCSGGRDGGPRVPWWLTQGWRFGKSTLTFVVRASGLPPPPHHPLRDLSLAIWPLTWPLDTVHVSHIWLFGMFDLEPQWDLQQNTSIRTDTSSWFSAAAAF